MLIVCFPLNPAGWQFPSHLVRACARVRASQPPPYSLVVWYIESYVVNTFLQSPIITLAASHKRPLAVQFCTLHAMQALAFPNTTFIPGDDPGLNGALECNQPNEESILAECMMRVNLPRIAIKPAEFVVFSSFVPSKLRYRNSNLYCQTWFALEG